MKKKLSFILLIIVIVIGFMIYSSYKEKEKSLNQALKTPAQNYFINYISSNSGISTYRITLKALKNAPQKYDLKKLKNCNENKTYADITIDFNDGSIKNTKIVLNCKMYK